MTIIHDLLKVVPDGEVLDVRIGLHWTSVVVEVDGVQQCGLASTLADGDCHCPEPSIPQAGLLIASTGRELAELCLSQTPLQNSIGMATVNALLPRCPQSWREDNAAEIIAGHAEGKRVVMIGRFRFAPDLQRLAKELFVLEQKPGPDDLPAEMAPQVLPHAEVIVITGMTLLNGTLEGLLDLCPPGAFVCLLGPSTPLSPVLFDYGVNVLSGAVVLDIQPVLQVVSQGGNFRQVHRVGVKLVNISQ
jgi:uncharacterized protein (DUF4213/DUF364 family)